MRQYFKSFVVAFFLQIAFVCEICAYDCKVDGIYYKLNYQNHTASVCNDSVQRYYYPFESRYGEDTYSGDITIPEVIIFEGETFTVSSISAYAFFGGDTWKDGYYGKYWTGLTSKLKSVLLPNSIVEIGSHAFYKCGRLTFVSIPSSVKKIGDCAFAQCINMDSIIIPKTIEEFGKDAFGFDYSKYVYIDNMNNETMYNKWISYAPLWQIYKKGLVIDLLKFEDGCIAHENELDALKYYYPHKLYLGGNIFTGQKGNVYSCNVDSVEELTFGDKYTLGWDRCENSHYISGGSGKIKIVNSRLNNPTIFQPIFTETTYQNATLYVPTGTKNLYKYVKGWKDFFDIQEKDFTTGIVKPIINTEAIKEVERYNIDGKKLSTPQQGINIIRYNDGSVKKVIVK